MEGYGATRFIHSGSPDLPVIAITAFAMPYEKEKTLNAGCTKVITKPINRMQLLLEISNSLKRV